MEELFPFGIRTHGLLFLFLVVSRGMDFLSTWVATPNMVLEGNPIAKKLGWKWGILVNVAICVLFAFWPLPAIVIGTTSVLVAARNFQSAWLMRSLGEHLYRQWHIERVQETSITLYLFCLFAQTLLVAGVGAAVIYFSQRDLDHQAGATSASQTGEDKELSAAHRQLSPDGAAPSIDPAGPLHVAKPTDPKAEPAMAENPPTDGMVRSAPTAHREDSRTPNALSAGEALLGVGLGIVAYAIAVAFFTLLGIVRLRRAFKAESRRFSEQLVSK
jgi:hypothetical protein